MIIARTDYHKRLIAAIFVTAILGFVFLFFNQEWFFDGEDCALILRSSSINSFDDIVKTFKYGLSFNSEGIELANPMSLPHTGQNFFSPYYRPCLILLYKLEFLAFGLNPYLYFLFFITSHILVALFLFFILMTFSNLTASFIYALLFGFSPMLYCWMGKVDLQQHSLVVIFTFFALYLIKKNNIFYRLFGFFLFLLSILTRETFIILPLSLLLLSKIKIGNFSNSSLHQKNKNIIFLGVVCLIAISIKLIAYPIQLHSNNALNLSANSLLLNLLSHLHLFFESFFLKLKNNVMWYPLFPFVLEQHLKKLTMLPLYMYNFIKLFYICGISTLLFHCRQKKALLLSIVAAILISWPAFAIIAAAQFFSVYSASERFFYESLPFWIICFGILTKDNTLLSKIPISAKRTFVVLTILLICFNARTLIKGMHFMMIKPKQTMQPIIKLDKQSINPHSPILVINPLGRNLHQPFQLYGITTIPKNDFCDSYYIDIHNNCSIDQIKNFLRIHKNKDSITLTSCNETKLYFSLKKDPKKLANIIIHETDNHDKITSLSLILNRKFLAKEPQIIVWFHNDNTFVVINS